MEVWGCDDPEGRLLTPVVWVPILAVDLGLLQSLSVPQYVLEPPPPSEPSWESGQGRPCERYLIA